MPHDVVDAIAVSADGNSVFVRSRMQLLRSFDSGSTWGWSNRGFDFSFGGNARRSTFLEFSPLDDNGNGVVFTVSKGRMFCSLDMGSHWTPVGIGGEKGVPVLFPLALVFSTTDKSRSGNGWVVLVAGSTKVETPVAGGEQLRRGIFRSVDGGVTFAEANLSMAFEPFDFEDFPRALLSLGCVDTNRTARSNIFVGTETGLIAASADNGITWSAVKLAGDDLPSLPGGAISSIVDLNPHSSLNCECNPSNGAFGVQLVVLTSDGSVFLAYETCGELGMFRTLTELSLVRIELPENTEGRPSIPVVSIQTHKGNNGRTQLYVLRQNDIVVASIPEEAILNPSELHWSEIGRANGLMIYQNNNRNNATYFGQSEFNILRSSQSDVFLGSFGGLYRSNDGGDSWTYLETLNGHITGLDLSRNQEHLMQLVVCTYASSCFTALIDTNMLLSCPGENVPTESVIEIPNRKNRRAYSQIALSPTFQRDGMAFRTAKMEWGIDITTDRFSTFEEVFPPKLNASDRAYSQVIEVSPDFISDSTVYVAGYNIGIAVSTNKGKTFRLLAEFGGGEIPQLSLARNGAMAVLVDHDPTGSKYSGFIYLSTDRGKTWAKLNRREKDWMSVVAVSNGKKVKVIGLRRNGRLYVFTEKNRRWKKLKGQGGRAADIFRPSSIKGGPALFGFNGIAVGPDGEFGAALQQGGLILGRIMGHGLSARRVVTLNATEPPATFAWLSGAGPRDIRQFKGALAFSPNFAEDGIAVGASYYSVFISFDWGANWREILVLPHRHMQS